jgi:LysM repeat protein
MMILLSGLLTLPAVAQTQCGVNHTVLRGQTLFRISLRYHVSVRAIAQANNVANVNLIYAGQTLVIPCASNATPIATGTYGWYLPSPTPYAFATPSPTPYSFTIPNGGTIDCTGFQTTSPLDGLPDGRATFYWNQPVSGKDITNYQVIVLDDAGRRLVAFETAGGFYNVSGDVSFNAIGGRSRFSWFAIALSHGVEACRSQMTTMNRAYNPNAGLSP